MKRFIRRNIKLLSILLVVILIGSAGFTAALILRFTPISVIGEVANVVANVRFEQDENEEDIDSITSTGEIVPTTLDISNINNVINSGDAVKLKFWVSGSSSNPNNSIYDISLRNVDVDCELRNALVKWVLYKNNTLLYSGNLSSEFDAMPNDRLVLTTTQQDLTATEDSYLFAIYIEDTCSSSSLSTCASSADQGTFLGKSFSADISIETAMGTKKTNTRTTSPSTSCTANNTSIQKLECADNLVYDGTPLNLIKNNTIPTGATVNQSTATKPGNYTITASLSSGYKWSDDSTSDYIFACSVAKRSITIVTTDQAEGTFTSSPANVQVINLVSGHSIHSIQLSKIATIDGDIITAGAAVIYDSSNNDVTNYYTINYQSLGKITAAE